MLDRVLEPEVMDTEDEARDYDAMDHSQVNRVFVADFLALWNGQGKHFGIGPEPPAWMRQPWLPARPR